MAGVIARDNRDAAKVVVASTFGVVGLGTAYVASRHPALALLGVVAVAAVAFALSRPLVAVSMLAASFFFEAYLSSGVGLVTPAKAIGGLAFVAWLIEWGVKRRPTMTAPHLWPMLGLGLCVVLATAMARDEHAALIVGFRYVTFFVLFFLVLQTVGGSIERAELITTVAVGAAGVAAFFGLYSFFVNHADRASGPLTDPNDYAFLLASIVPVALAGLASTQRRARRVFMLVCTALMFAAILATFSRSSLIGLAAAGAWALFSGRVPLRWLVGALVLLVFAGLTAYQLQPDVVNSAFQRKQHVADANVNSRLSYWQVAIEEWQGAPLTGVGPGNYEVRFPEHQLPSDEGPPATHNAYLNVLAELGLPGAVFFVLFLAMGWRTLRRRVADPRRDRMMMSLAAGFVVAMVGALFLTEQFYPPLWFLSAVGVGLVGGADGVVGAAGA